MKSKSKTSKSRPRLQQAGTLYHINFHKQSWVIGFPSYILLHIVCVCVCVCNDVYAICFLGYSGLYIGMRHAPMLGDRQYQISPHINIGALFCSVRFIASSSSSLHYICVLACSPLVNVDLGKESTIEPIQRNCVRKRRVCVCVCSSPATYIGFHRVS